MNYERRRAMARNHLVTDPIEAAKRSVPRHRFHATARAGDEHHVIPPLQLVAHSKQRREARIPIAFGDAGLVVHQHQQHDELIWYGKAIASENCGCTRCPRLHHQKSSLEYQ